ncbi:MAG: mannitol dehydrogenase family protein, partial [Verrucomicrobia bacterium]|nr:mannitol dehydrogenase family protein [Verrucomicrobiota bacterium]
MLRLNQANLANVPPTIPTPAYDRSKKQFTIAHIGVGGFHRAHQAVYLDDLLQQESGWRIAGIGLLEQDRRMRDVLSSQDYLYAVVERSAASDKARIIGSIGEYLFAPEERDLVIDKMTEPTTPIVSLTITENGYYVNQATGEFDDRNPEILYDLDNPHQPKCSFGFIVEALDRQRRRGLQPFTLLSCDNLQGNGEVARKMILAFAELRDPGLRNWIESNVSFPNSMVDRITPATTDEDRAMVRDKFQIEDGWPVVCEPFRQWVIEDHFPAGRPAWEKAGAQITDDVLPYEKMKIRLLNAGHQALCYIGMLLGYKFAHEAMGDDSIRKFVKRMMDT